MPLSKKAIDAVEALFEGAYAVRSTMPCHSVHNMDFVVTQHSLDKPYSIHHVQCLCGTKYRVKLHNVRRKDGTYTHSLVWAIEQDDTLHSGSTT